MNFLSTNASHARAQSETARATPPGQPLPARFRHLLGSRSDLAGVIRARVADIDALGASEGTDIVVRRDDRSGRAERTWAHEIAHVLQRATPGLPQADAYTAEIDAAAFARSAAAGRTPRPHVAAPPGRLRDDDDVAFIRVEVAVDREMNAAEFVRELLRQRYGVYSEELLDRIIAGITKADAPLLPPGFRVTPADVKAGKKVIRIPEDLDWEIDSDYLGRTPQVKIHSGPSGSTPARRSSRTYSKELAEVVKRLQTLFGTGFFEPTENDLEHLRRIQSQLERMSAAEIAEFKRTAVSTDDLEAFERSLSAFLAARDFARLAGPQSDKSKSGAEMQFWQSLPQPTLELLGQPTQYTPDQYAQLRRIAEKLKRFAPEDLAVTKMAKLRPIGDLDQFEKFVDLFLARKAELKKAMDKLSKSEGSSKEPSGTSATKSKGDGPSSMQEAIEETWQGFDDSRIATMSEDERYMAAMKQRNKVAAAEFKYMKDHPGETAADFLKSATLQNTSETFEGIGRDLQEFASGDANAYARWAAGMGAGAKLSGWLLAVGAILYALSWLTGVGELATIATFMTYMLASTIVLAAAESDLRLKAASQAKTPEEFKKQATASGQAAFAVFFTLATLAVALAIRFIAKTYFPKAVERFNQAIKRFREKIRIVGRLDTLKVEFTAEVQEVRQKLVEAGEQAKKGATAAADAVDKLTIDEFIDKLELGDDDLFRQPDAQGAKVPWRELAKTPAGAKAIARYKAQMSEMLRSSVIADIDDEVKTHVDAVDQLIDDVKKATTADELEAAASRGEKFLSPEEVARRGKAREAQARAEAEKNALKQLEDEQKAEEARQREEQEKAAAEEKAAREKAEKDAADKAAKQPPKDKPPKKTKEDLERERLAKQAKEEAARRKKEAKADYKPCFLAGTLIDTPAGPIAIETLRGGDIVLGKRPGEAPWPQPVRGLCGGRTELAIHVRVGGVAIQTTASHRFCVVDRGWIAARDLAPGYLLEGADGGDATVEAVDRIDLPAPTATYNFGVPAEAYLVVAAGRRVLVHNSGLPDFDRVLYWVWGDPKVRLPGSKGVIDWDGKSVWKTTSKADVEVMMEFRVKVMKRPVDDDHAFWTEDQIAAGKLQNVKTPSDLPLADKLDHHSLRPPDASADNASLSEPQLKELDALVNKLPPPQPVEPWELQGTC